jgi:hypothetical protein
VVRLRDHLNRMVDDLNRRLEQEELQLLDKWRLESERLQQKLEEEKTSIYASHEKDMAELR